MRTKIENNIKKTITGDGIRIVSERVESVRSVAVGIWFITGSRNESSDSSGISHFIEHMLFKGTKKRSALSIAREIEQVGGYLNAFTSKEITAYFAHLLDEHLPLAMDVLSDMMSSSLFSEKLIQREKGVVLEEISSAEDTPEDVIHEDFTSLVFPRHSLGRPVLGKRETVSGFKRSDLLGYWSRNYLPRRTVIAAAGRVDHDKLVSLVEKKLKLSNGRNPRSGPYRRSTPKKLRHERRKDIVQAHLCLGTRGLPYDDPRKFAFFVLNTVLGSGMSSRLFQRVRERNGLAYSIYSFHEAYRDTGLFGIYAGTEEAHVQRAELLIREELKKLIERKLSSTELKRAKDQLKGALMLGLESISSRMNRLARMEIYTENYLEIDELLRRINAVTVEDVQDIAKYLFTGDLFSAYLLPNGNEPGRQ